MKSVSGLRFSSVRLVGRPLSLPSSRRSLRAAFSPYRLHLPTTQGLRILCPRLTASHNGTNAATSAEEIANRRRWEESGNKEGSVDAWQWTLNWNEITEHVLAGSCPRSREDIDRIVSESGATAILSLQCDMCLEALKIDYEDLSSHGSDSGILMTRVPIRDFDHGDQALMLPEAVRTLALLIALEYKVYVHCTAGINRATLTVLGYLTFGWDLYSALQHIKKKRPQANPYIDCWKSVKTRLLEGRSEEVIALSRKFFQKNEQSPKQDSFGNWLAAEDLVIKETFRRLLSSSVSTISALTDLKAASMCSVCVSPDEIDRANREIDDLHYELNIQRRRLAAAGAAIEEERVEHEKQISILKSREKINGNTSVKATEIASHPIQNPGSPLMVYDELVRVKEEVNELKKCIRKIAMLSNHALSVDAFDDEWTDGETEIDGVIDLHEEEDKDGDENGYENDAV